METKETPKVIELSPPPNYGSIGDGLGAGLIPQHLYAVSDTITKIDWNSIKQMAELIANAGMTYVIGNGGSAATASHFAADLAKAAGIRIMALDNLAALTAWTNDMGPFENFSGPLSRLHQGDNEALIAISTSGMSANVVRAARDFRGAVIALTGSQGGLLADSQGVAVHIAVPADVIEVVEDCHSAICHAVVRLLKGAGEHGGRGAEGQGSSY